MNKSCEGCTDEHCEACPIAFLTEVGEEYTDPCNGCINEDTEECLWCQHNSNNK